MGRNSKKLKVEVIEEEEESWSERKQKQIQELAEKLIYASVSDDLDSQIQAARDIRKLAKTSVRTRSCFALAGVIKPLISMLNSCNIDAREASLLAILNLAVRNERNKVNIVTSGAVSPLIELLKDENDSLRELATAAILTLSASPLNKQTIAASGAAPLLVRILNSGSVQGKVDAVTALYNLSTSPEDLTPIISAGAIPPLLSLLNECKKYSKFAEKTSGLLEILSNFEEALSAISDYEGGILILVETVEGGSLISSENAVGVLLALCRSSRDKYRKLILGEGAIPGLLQLTVEGSPKAQEMARELLDFLRDSPEKRLLPKDVLESIVYDIASRVDGADKKGNEAAKRLLEDMVHRSMEISMNRLQLRAASCTPSEVPNM
ncbi:hypothetical protein GIB67_013471 [Kingdonia uniflora]|uniref:U-box domain-containing protein n=1 Tax=Kingdonia uniflora TaxID=39325 RepID=A0A7J7LRE2_9MAGN|nr:hypothetical protein GIB67_013471 [Kingdonia uniflora]